MNWSAAALAASSEPLPATVCTLTSWTWPFSSIVSVRTTSPSSLCRRASSGYSAGVKRRILGGVIEAPRSAASLASGFGASGSA